jgi:hypothetical protein
MLLFKYIYLNLKAPGNNLVSNSFHRVHYESRQTVL